jgi:hypothetical protein
MSEIQVTIKLYQAKSQKIEEDIFKCADFWLGKGYLI